MATIVKTPSGTWKAVIRKNGWPTASKTFRTKRDASDWSRRVEDEMVRGVYIQRTASERMTVEQALRRYVTEVSPTKAPKTLLSEQGSAKKLIARLGRYSLAALSPEIIAEYRDQRLAEQTRRKTPVSNNSVRLELALLSHLFNVAIREWGIGLPFNPLLNIRKPSPGKGRDRRLAPDEERRLYAAVDAHPNPFMGHVVRIAVETGMRSSEITHLRRRQVDVDRRVVRLGETKNGETRLVPLSPTATAVFRQALNHPYRPIDTDLIFFGEPGRDGKRRPYQFSKSWRRIKNEVGMADLRFHDLRHEAVSRLVELGLSDQEVSAISGHKSMQMVKRYTHLRGEDLVGRIDTLLKKRGRQASLPVTLE